MSVPRPRDAAEDPVTLVQVVITLATTVPVLGAPDAAEAAAWQIVREEIDGFCADFGWELTNDTTAAVR